MFRHGDKALQALGSVPRPLLPYSYQICGWATGKRESVRAAEAYCVAIVAKEAHRTAPPEALLLKQAPEAL